MCPALSNARDLGEKDEVVLYWEKDELRWSFTERKMSWSFTGTVWAGPVSHGCGGNALGRAGEG